MVDAREGWLQFQKLKGGGQEALSIFHDRAREAFRHGGRVELWEWVNTAFHELPQQERCMVVASLLEKLTILVDELEKE